MAVAAEYLMAQFRFGVLFCMLIFLNPVFAGAWLRPPGAGQMIFQSSYTAAGSSFGPENIEKFQKTFVTAYADYGISDRVTVFAIPQYTFVRVKSRDDNFSGQYYAIDGGARVGLLSGSNILSLQASYKYGQGVGLAIPQGFVSLPQAEARILYGHNFYICGHKIYTDTEGFWRWTSAPFQNEAGLDATVGMTVNPYTEIMVQNFTVFSAGYGKNNYPHYAQHKAVISVVETLVRGWQVQLSGLFAYAGHNVVAERGAALALWISF